jgi:hypothetical protein
MTENVFLQRIVVKQFIRYRTLGKVKVRSFQRLATHLDTKAPRTGESWSASDAEAEFTRLIALVSKNPDSWEPEIAEAYDSLFLYVTQVLVQDTSGTKHFLPTLGEGPTLYDAIEILGFKMDKRDENTTAILIDLKTWMNKYGQILDKINTEYDQGKERIQKIGQNH